MLQFYRYLSPGAPVVWHHMVATHVSLPEVTHISPPSSFTVLTPYLQPCTTLSFLPSHPSPSGGRAASSPLHPLMAASAVKWRPLLQNGGLIIVFFLPPFRSCWPDLPFFLNDHQGKPTEDTFLIYANKYGAMKNATHLHSNKLFKKHFFFFLNKLFWIFPAPITFVAP